MAIGRSALCWGALARQRAFSRSTTGSPSDGSTTIKPGSGPIKRPTIVERRTSALPAKHPLRPAHKTLMAKVYIPAQWRDLTGEVAQLDVEGNRLSQIVAVLEARFPGI